MKNLFGVNVTEKKDNEVFDGEIFISRKISQKTENALNNITTEQEIINKKIKLPLWAEIIQALAFFAAAVITGAILSNIGNWHEGYENAPYFFYIAPICWIIYALLKIWEKTAQNIVFESREFSEHIEDTVNNAKLAMKELEIPENAPSIDALAEKYIIKKDEVKHKDFPMFSHINLDMFIYVRDNMLCLADLYQVWEIPVSSIISVESSGKKASFPNWHKQLPFNAPDYKPYKIVMNNNGAYFCKYSIIRINDIKGEFSLLIPDYDVPLFEELTKVRCNENN